MITIAYRRRALPIAWSWVRCAKGHSNARKQLALLAYVRRLIPKDVPVLLVGDSEFGAVPVIRQLEKWQWNYVLRQKANHQVKLASSNIWQRLGDLIQNPGQSIWLGPALLTAKHAHPINLLIDWKKGEETPWLLATNFATRGLHADYEKRLEEVCSRLYQPHTPPSANADPEAGRTTVPARTPVLNEGQGLATGKLGRRAPEAANGGKSEFVQRTEP